MSARARSMALARALLERSHQGLDEIPRPTALGAANGVSNGQRADQEVCWAASHFVPACTPLLLLELAWALRVGEWAARTCFLSSAESVSSAVPLQ